MCFTCGCNDARKRMGNNLTYADIRDVAVENGRRVDESLLALYAAAADDRAQHVEEYQHARDSGQG